MHRQVVAGTNFRLKLRLRNRIAPDCSNDEVSLHHHHNYDEDGEKGDDDIDVDFSDTSEWNDAVNSS